MTKCYTHSEADSVGVCTRCGKNVCAQCSIELNGKLVCKTCAEGMIASSQTSPPAQPYVAQPYAAQPGVVVVKHKEPILSAILSLFIPGLGQVYNGQVLKGIIILALYVGLWAVSGMLMFVLIGFCTMLLPVVLWLYAIYDAYVVAGKINRGQRV